MKISAELNGSVEECAKRLLGCELVRTLPDGTRLRARIVETEAYDETDEGSHSFKGQTSRNSVMFGPAGFLYVYFIYGMHFCCNIVTGPSGVGEAVLIRAVEPIEGEATMRIHRGGVKGSLVTNGPSKLCVAMGITMDINGHNLEDAPLQLIMKSPRSSTEIGASKRIGLSKAIETHWRFYLKQNPYVSKHPK